MQNTICLTGRLTKEPEQRHAGNKPMVVCSIAVAKKFKKPDQPDSDFFDLVLWSPQQGDYLVNYGGKGRLVAVSGRMESRTYNDNDGNKRTAWTVNVSEVSILDRPKEGEAGESVTGSGTARGTSEGESMKHMTRPQNGSTSTPSSDEDSYDPFS